MELWFTWAAILLAAAAVFVAIPPLLKTPGGRRWAVAAIAVLVVAVGLGVLGTVFRPRDPVDVTFAEPALNHPPIEPKKTVHLVGTVRNLPKGHTLWIVSKPFDDDSNYYVVQGEPATRHDGTWDAHDKGVGDKSDSGKGFYYFPVDADEVCSKTFKTLKLPRKILSDPKKADDNGLPDGCHRLDSSAIIRIRTK